jgi:prolipoprotein diacylglyceryltransferase
VLWQAILGYSLIRVITDGFVAESAIIGGMRVSQMMALVVALVSVLLLARRPENRTETRNESP